MLRGLAIQISRSDRRREAHLSGVAFPCQEPFFTFLATSFNLRQPQMIPSAAPDSPRAHVRPAGWPPGPRAGSLTPASRASARALDDDPDFKDLHHHQPSGSSLPCRTRARFVAERAACVKPVWTTTGYRHLSRPSSIYNVAAPIRGANCRPSSNRRSGLRLLAASVHQVRRWCRCAKRSSFEPPRGHPACSQDTRETRGSRPGPRASGLPYSWGAAIRLCGLAVCLRLHSGVSVGRPVR
jgi:hypothetical protein